MRLHLDHLGRCGSDHPCQFWRVETWRTGSRVADFTSPTEAHAFAMADTKERGFRELHKVCQMTITSGRA